jgi:hypothetical protein
MHDAGLVRDFESLGHLRHNRDGVGYRQARSALGSAVVGVGRDFQRDVAIELRVAGAKR